MSSNKSLVVKDNRLIEASYRLDLSEQRLVLMAIVQARDSMPITSDTLLEVSASDYASLCQLEPSSAYRRLKEAADSLFLRWVQLKGVDTLTGKPAVLKTRWVSSCTYVEKAGLVRLRIAPDIIPYITELEARFTSYALKNVVQMTSTYAIRLYELLVQYKTIGSREFYLDELKELLDANEKSYERLDNFRKKVLNVAVGQINDLTDLQIMCTDKKVGRSVVGFDFSIVQKNRENTAEKRPIKPQETPAAVSLPISLTTAERAMLKDLQAVRPDITLEMIQAMSDAQGIDPLMVMIKLKKTI
jgi:plasmid replication initiation protein